MVKNDKNKKIADIHRNKLTFNDYIYLEITVKDAKYADTMWYYETNIMLLSHCSRGYNNPTNVVYYRQIAL